MSSSSVDKENEEPAQDVLFSSNNEEENSVNISHTLPVEEDVHPLPDTNKATSVKNFESEPTLIHHQELPASVTSDAIGGSLEPDIQPPAHVEVEDNEVHNDKTGAEANEVPHTKNEAEFNEVSDTKTHTEVGTSKPISVHSEPPNNTVSANFEPPAKPEAEPSSQAPEPKSESAIPKPNAASSDITPQNVNGTERKNEVKEMELPKVTMNDNSNSRHSFLLDENYEGSESGTEEEQSAFMKELENFFRERSMEFKPPKFYGEGLNCLKLWRAVTRLGGYDKVTSCKLWRQVGESFKPPKTCTTVSWTFRGFYEKALLDYERHKTCGGELSLAVASHSETMNIDNQASGSGRARRDAAARAMQGWHSQRVLGNGEVSDPIIKDKNSMSMQKREKQLKSLGLLKRKKQSYIEHPAKAARSKPSKPQLDIAVVDIGQPADWVKINVQKTKDCFEVYALVPGLLREEVRVQSDPAGRLVISGEPEHPDNPWGVTPFKKVVSLPARIDPHQTSAVVTLHGQLFVRVPFEPTD